MRPLGHRAGRYSPKVAEQARSGARATALASPLPVHSSVVWGHSTCHHIALYRCGLLRPRPFWGPLFGEHLRRLLCAAGRLHVPFTLILSLLPDTQRRPRSPRVIQHHQEAGGQARGKSGSSPLSVTVTVIVLLKSHPKWRGIETPVHASI